MRDLAARRAEAALISPEYVALQQALHADPRGYGQRGHKWAPVIAELVETLGASSVLDYGCGQGSLARALAPLLPLAVRVSEYDPAIVEKSRRPGFADLVVSTDVLEHVEPERLAAVLRHFHQLARRAVFLVVSLVETAKILEDGRNAHLIVQPADWWAAQCSAAGFVVGPPPASARQKPEKEWVAVLTPREREP